MQNRHHNISRVLWVLEGCSFLTPDVSFHLEGPLSSHSPLSITRLRLIDSLHFSLTHSEFIYTIGIISPGGKLLTGSRNFFCWDGTRTKRVLPSPDLSVMVGSALWSLPPGNHVPCVISPPLKVWAWPGNLLLTNNMAEVIGYHFWD